MFNCLFCLLVEGLKGFIAYLSPSMVRPIAQPLCERNLRGKITRIFSFWIEPCLVRPQGRAQQLIGLTTEPH